MGTQLLPIGVAALFLAACSGGGADDGERVVMRDLEPQRSVAEGPGARLSGTPIPTPSDTRARYTLLRERETATGTVIAIFRREVGDGLTFIRAEIDCEARLFHVVGTGDSMARVESDLAHDGPLRPITGLPLRQELAQFICARSGKPLTAA